MYIALGKYCVITYVQLQGELVLEYSAHKLLHIQFMCLWHNFQRADLSQVIIYYILNLV
jgi:hypothetical protein